MALSERENFLRTIEFRDPEWMPILVEPAPATWQKYREALERIVLRHPLAFGAHQQGRVDFDHFCNSYGAEEYFTDEWGCVWQNLQGGMLGQVVQHPLADWGTLATYQPPDPLVDGNTIFGRRNWSEVQAHIDRQKAAGIPVQGIGDCLFDRLYYLRGFEELMMDIATDAPELAELIRILTEYELKLVGRLVGWGVDLINFHTDIGSQKALMISPAKFRKHIKPMFEEIFGVCRDGGTHVYLSSDGYMLEIVDDLLECGVSMHDPQLRVNTLDGIIRQYKGRMCVRLDLDQQMFPFCTPADIHRQVQEAVTKLGSPRGGLMLWAWAGPDVPLENIEAIAVAMEEFRTYWWDGRA